MKSQIKDGGPAFPSRLLVKQFVQKKDAMMATGPHGMTLRDWFAGQALAGWAAGRNNPGALNSNAAEVANACYKYAAAMLAAKGGDNMNPFPPDEKYEPSVMTGGAYTNSKLERELEVLRVEVLSLQEDRRTMIRANERLRAENADLRSQIKELTTGEKTTTETDPMPKVPVTSGWRAFYKSWMKTTPNPRKAAKEDKP